MAEGNNGVQIRTGSPIEINYSSGVTRSGALFARKSIGKRKVTVKRRNYEKENRNRRTARLEAAVTKRAKGVEGFHLFIRVLPNGTCTINGSETLLQCAEFTDELGKLVQARVLKCQLAASRTDQEMECVEDGALADGELADGELADGEMEDAEVEEEMGVLWETIQDWDIKKMNIGAKRKAITGLVLNGKPNIRSVWGVQDQRPAWWPHTLPFDSPNRKKLGGGTVFSANDLSTILNSAQNWIKMMEAGMKETLYIVVTPATDLSFIILTYRPAMLLPIDLTKSFMLPLHLPFIFLYITKWTYMLKMLEFAVLYLPLEYLDERLTFTFMLKMLELAVLYLPLEYLDERLTFTFMFQL